MYQIFVANENRPFNAYVARNISCARRIAKVESECYAPEMVKIINIHTDNPRPTEVWQNGKKVA